MKAARALVAALRDPSSTRRLDADGWTGLLTAARPERLLGTLADRLAGEDLRPDVRAILVDAAAEAEHGRTAALWEAEMARRALAPLGIRTVLLKGTAYAAAGLDAARGRTIGDLDILVPRDRLDEAEAAILAGGWEHVKTGEYDQRYYREWMHELPPLIHAERNRMIDVHHTILPLTHRSRPFPGDLLDQSRDADGGLAVLAPEHMVVHAAAHLIADGDLSGGLRNLWDIDRLCRQLASGDAHFFLGVAEEAWAHGLYFQVQRALRLSARLYGTPLVGYRSPTATSYHPRSSDRLFLRRLLARDGWGRQRRPATRLAFIVREHGMRMPPVMLARHLFRKATAKRG